MYEGGVTVALRKESVDRNTVVVMLGSSSSTSLSARRAWIEIPRLSIVADGPHVALRKESVDRNFCIGQPIINHIASLSARRAWIEMQGLFASNLAFFVALRKESVDRNKSGSPKKVAVVGRSPQGERG